MNQDILKIKRKIVQLSYNSQEGHIASSFSILDIIYVLYKKILNVSIETINNPNRDRFILSKGHASIGLYAILAEFGFIEDSELDSFCRYGSRLGGHPDRNKVPGVECSTGSLGHGFPMAVGMAMGLKIKGSVAKVYSIIGDGELNEGSMWEAILLAGNHNLSNLFCIVDYNHSTDRAVDVSSLADKFRAFSWHVTTIDGHNHEDIFNVLSSRFNKPCAVIANTIKGYGCKLMENNPEWHHKSPNEEQLRIFLEELK